MCAQLARSHAKRKKYVPLQSDYYGAKLSNPCAEVLIVRPTASSHG